MSTVVSILDRDNRDDRTDNIGIVEPLKRRVLWIPRDLWCNTIKNRINRAFGRGGHKLLLSCLEEHKIKAESSICFRRSATIHCFRDLQVFVPIDEVMRFWYPLHPTKPIEEGRKPIVFSPPGELLSGERIHQWIGARISFDKGGSDLNRIERQKTLLRCLLEQNFDFKKLIVDQEYFSIYGSNVFEDLKQVGPDWKFETLGPLKHAKIGQMLVVVKMSRIHPRAVIRKLLAHLKISPGKNFDKN
ncbi:MAG: hypothetical protein A3J42_02755 [Candidatus Dadabacteria bacterium RIFCSPHIGHO2_12_FULL_53_21]|nr:MAG: hypothetical protein A3J42_02755 [Candidatus Dadabacteria bacterium RIFCSPHIGHO2_12_FULL_53_21]